MSNDKFERWETIENKDLLVRDPWVKLSVQTVLLPNGNVVDDYYQIRLPEYAVVFAETTDGRVIIERQYKHGVGESSLVLPSGLIELGEAPLDAAQRELLEETGYSANDWRYIGGFVVNGNYGCGKAHIFIAHNASQVNEPNSGDLETITVLTMSLSEILEATYSGQVKVLSSAAAIALASNFLPQAQTPTHA